MGGARRDEEKARAKERFFRIGTSLDNGIPKIKGQNYGTCLMDEKIMGEHFRVFPISNWTEMDVWEYIKLENIKLPSLIFFT